MKFTAKQSWMASVINTRADSWITVAPTSGDAGDVVVNITTQSNESYDDRSATIVFTSGGDRKEVVVTQKKKDAILLTASKVEVDNAASTVNITVKSNVSYQYEIDAVCKSWISDGMTGKTRGLAESVVKFSVDANNNLESREGYIYFISGDIKEKVTIYQQGSLPKIVISKKDELVSSDGGPLTIEVASNVNVELSPVSVSWLRENKTRSYSTNTYSFIVDRNDSYDYREAVLTFTNAENGLKENVKVTQMPKDALVVAQTDYHIPLEGTMLALEVQASVKPQVSIPADVTWIRLHEDNTRVIESHRLFFDIEKNNNDKSRQAVITFTSGQLTQTVNINQEGKADVLAAECEVLRELRDALTIDGVNFEFTGYEYTQFAWTDNIPMDKWIGVTWEDGHIVEIRVPEWKSNLAGRVYHTGKIPSSIAKLTHLRKLVISDKNLGMTAPILAEIGRLTSLEELIVYACNIPGGIPEELGNLTKLKVLRLINEYTPEKGDLQETVYSSTIIPETLGNLVNLEELDLRWNITSSIPESFGKLSKMQELTLTNETRDAFGNKFAENVQLGPIPSSISGMKKLRRLDTNLGFTGEIPSSIGDLTELGWCYISSNYLTGTLPSSMSKLSKLTHLSIFAPNMTGEIPSSFGKLTNIEGLTLEGGFIGDIPESLGKCKKLRLLNLKANFTSFPGSLAFILDNRKNCCTNGDVGSFHIGGNRFTGKIPEEILNHPNFYLFAPNFLDAQQEGNGFDLSDFKMPACKDTYKDVKTGESIDLAKLYSKNKYTIVFRYSSYYDYDGDNAATKKIAESVKRLYETYKDIGLGVICSYVDSHDGDAALSEQLGTSGFTHIRENGYETLFYNATIGCTHTTPTVGVVDSDGFYSLLNALDTQLSIDKKFRSKYHIYIGDLESKVAKIMFE